ncbi:serine protease, S1-C subfamily, contains C-terminal PDZ domain [Pedococcus dokdonensis]|uniref:Serine protease, S1-C subfamily, contains C-terminal PDZ domain n=1 Tax=Pedococcus dokdonensis TaxID=443156 RepID=A0A1H0RKZ6_9MICO|nr:trypsin-like peptidase domain-containing protein [Pedococcus dokdonensis]SDP30177.1 serine protease, S1-C subfamily, contains C-terminal PDZ domain [Pedococcus dokdonensis]
MQIAKRPLPLLLGAAGIASATAIAIGGAQLAHTASASGATTGTSIARSANPYAGSSGSGADLAPRGWPGWGGSTGGGSGGSGGGSGGSTGSTGSGSTTEATARQLVGVVDIVSTVNYGQGEAAGTGMVLRSDGEVLTNNHVIEGATSIEVTVLSTGRTYSATVVGTSPTNDVAVLQLSGATGLATVDLGDSSSLQVGDAVTGVGNAGNEEGTSAATGQVTALDQDITASDGSGTDSEDLSGLIMTDAAIEAGDSGGPLYDADGQVVGIDTAAQTSRTGETVAGYAIPIDTALAVAQKIRSGVDDATIHQGVPAFLGIQTGQVAVTGGVPVVGIVDGSAAEAAGITSGSAITRVGGTPVSTSSGLTDALTAHDPGDRVAVTWVDAYGTAHSATVTLGSGPAD